MKDAIPKTEYKKNFGSAILKLLIWILIIAAIGGTIYYFTNTYLIRWPISGSSMTNTLQDKDTVLVFKTQNVDYDDIIIFNMEEYADTDKERHLIKRVIGKGGDVISIRFDEANQCYHIYRNDEFVTEEHIKENMTSAGGYSEKTVTVPDGYYYVLGDNRNNSHDSHYGVYARKDLIEGIAIMRMGGGFDIDLLT